MARAVIPPCADLWDSKRSSLQVLRINWFKRDAAREVEVSKFLWNVGTLRYNPEDNHLHKWRRENLKPYLLLICFSESAK
jgi:hypothetical protein